MANENKNAPGAQGTGGRDQKTEEEPSDAGRQVSRQSGNQPHERPDYEEDPPNRPGYDLDIETEIPDGKGASDQPGAGQSDLGSFDAGVDDPTPARGSRYFPPPDEERQAKKRP